MKMGSLEQQHQQHPIYAVVTTCTYMYVHAGPHVHVVNLTGWILEHVAPLHQYDGRKGK